MNRDEILNALEDEREKFLEAIEGLPEEALLEPGVVGEWSIKDLMAHISMWEAWLIRLLWQISQGETPTRLIPAEQVDEVNAAWHAQAKDRPLEQVMEDFRQARKQTARRVLAFSDRDLSDPQRYPWAKGNTLAEIIAMNTWAHEAEHTAQIQAWRQKTGR